MNHTDLLKSMVSKFDSIMDRKVDIYLRQSIRLNSTVRAGMIILGIVGFSIFLLLYSLSSQVGHMQVGVQQMTHHFQQVEANMRQVSEILGNIEARVALMDAIEDDMHRVQGISGSLQKNMANIDVKMTEINRHMQRMQQHMQVVNGQMANMQVAVGGVTRETHRISKPANILP